MRLSIDSGEYAGGFRLPAKDELVEHFRLSLSTVREALIVVEVEGRVRACTSSHPTTETICFDRDFDAGVARIVKECRAHPLHRRDVQPAAELLF